MWAKLHMRILQRLALNKSGCYICRMSCQQLYIEEKIQIILYTAKYMHVRINYDNVSFGGRGGGGHEKK